MIGKLTYRRNKKAGGYDIFYQGPFDTLPQLLCIVVKTEEGKWEVPLPNGPLGPFKDRWHAGFAFLDSLLTEPAKALEMKVRCQWADLNLKRWDSRALDAQLAGKIYDILIEKCRANADHKEWFVDAHTEQRQVESEWRFCGLLGFGGKFRNFSDRLYVDCYPENENPETLWIMAETNEAIFKLWQQHSADRTTDARATESDERLG